MDISASPLAQYAQFQADSLRPENGRKVEYARRKSDREQAEPVEKKAQATAQAQRRPVARVHEPHYYPQEISARNYQALQTFQNIRNFDPGPPLVDTYA